MSLTASPHLRGIVIAGVLATVALALGFVTLGMNQAGSSAAPHKVLSLKERGLASGKPKTPTKAAKKVAHKAPNPHLVAALKGGLPRSIAQALAAKPVTVVAFTSSTDSVAALALREAKAGAALAGASFVQLSVDRNDTSLARLTALLGQLPVSPAVLVYARPATLYVQLTGFNDRTVVQQAAHSAVGAKAPAAATAPAAA